MWDLGYSSNSVYFCTFSDLANKHILVLVHSKSAGNLYHKLGQFSYLFCILKTWLVEFVTVFKHIEFWKTRQKNIESWSGAFTSFLLSVCMSWYCIRVTKLTAKFPAFADFQQIGGRTSKVNFPEVPRGGEREVMSPKIRSSYQGYVDSPFKIYAGNLSWSLTSQALRDAFSHQPGYLSAKIIYDRDSGRSRGFGFITFSSAEEVESALSAMNGVVRNS